MQTAWMKPLVQITGDNAPESLYENLGRKRRTAAQVRLLTQTPPLAAAIAAERLRHLAALLHNADQGLLGLIQSPAGDEWRGQLIRDMVFMQKLVAPKLDSLGLPGTAWEAFILEWPAQWAQLVKQMLATAAERQLSSDSQPQENDNGHEDGEWLCADCGAEFQTRHALQCHRHHRHGYRRPGMLVAAGPVCPVCGINFHSRWRVARHLEMGAQRCQQALREGRIPRLTDDELQAADLQTAAAKRSARRVGIWLDEGPRAVRPRQCAAES